MRQGRKWRWLRVDVAVAAASLLVGALSTVQAVCVCDQSSYRVLLDHGSLFLQFMSWNDAGLTWSSLVPPDGTVIWDASVYVKTGMFPHPIELQWQCPGLNQTIGTRHSWWTFVCPLWVPLAISVLWRSLAASVRLIANAVQRLREREHIRRRLVVLSVALAALSVVTWVSAGMFSIVWPSATNYGLSVSKGALIVAYVKRDGKTYPGSVQLRREPFSLANALPRSRVSSWRTATDKWGPVWLIPLWIPPSLAMIPLFLLPRRHPLGHCQRCGYDLRLNTSGVCPECGSTTKKAAAPASSADPDSAKPVQS